MNLRRLLPYSAVVVGAMVFSIALQASAAFTQPAGAPPTADADAPLTTGLTGQAKLGGLILNSGGATNGLIVQSGKVGIGTVVPIATLDVKSVTDEHAVVRGHQSYASGITLSSLNDANNAFKPLELQASSFDFTQGNVGIGTISPLQKLHVVGNALISGDFLRPDNLGSALTLGNGTNKYYGAHEFRNAAGPTVNMLIQDAGNVGIGTAAPGAKLDVVGLIRNSAPTQGTIELSGLLPGYADNTYPTLKGSGLIYFSASGVYSGYWSGADLHALGSMYAGAFFYASDESLKKDIVTIPNALTDVLKLRGVEFNWKADGKPSVGVIAQEVEKVYPQLVSTDVKTGLKSVEYGNLVGPLIEAVKEQQKQIDAQNKSIQELQRQLKDSPHQ